MCDQHNVKMTPEFVYINLTFNMLSLTQGSSSSVPALN